MTLTAKQQRFVDEYLIDLNATQAAIRAGYSDKTANQIGPKLLVKVGIAAEISKAMAARSKRTQIEADRVVQELAGIGFASLADVANWGTREVAFGYTEDGKRLPAEDIGDAAVVRYERAPFLDPVDRDELAPEIRAAIAEFKLTKDGFGIKMHDKVAALDKLLRHLGGYNKDTLTVTGKDGAPLLTTVRFVKMSSAKPEDPDA